MNSIKKMFVAIALFVGASHAIEPRDLVEKKSNPELTWQDDCNLAVHHCCGKLGCTTPLGAAALIIDKGDDPVITFGIVVGTLVALPEYGKGCLHAGYGTCKLSKEIKDNVSGWLNEKMKRE